MNALFILAMIPDAILRDVCRELRTIVDALEKRNVHDITVGGQKVVSIIVEAAEAHGFTAEKIIALIQQYAPQIELPVDLIEEMLKGKKEPSRAN